MDMQELGQSRSCSLTSLQHRNIQYIYRDMHTNMLTQQKQLQQVISYVMKMYFPTIFMSTFLTYVQLNSRVSEVYMGGIEREIALI